MNKATKGALAAAAAGTLMLGGAGTLAYWTGTGTVNGATIVSGQVTMASPVCDNATSAGTHEWKYSGGSHDGDDFDPATAEVVPGDVIVKVCDVELTTSGDHIKVKLAANTPALNDAASTLDTELGLTSAWVDTDDDSPVVNNTTTITGAATKTYRATVTVTFSSAVTSVTSQSGHAVLDAVTLTATQVANS